MELSAAFDDALDVLDVDIPEDRVRLLDRARGDAHDLVDRIDDDAEDMLADLEDDEALEGFILFALRGQVTLASRLGSGPVALVCILAIGAVIAGIVALVRDRRRRRNRLPE